MKCAVKLQKKSIQQYLFKFFSIFFDFEIKKNQKKVLSLQTIKKICTFAL
jgi:hypothetical protein